MSSKIGEGVYFICNTHPLIDRNTGVCVCEGVIVISLWMSSKIRNGGLSYYVTPLFLSTEKLVWEGGGSIMI